MIKISQLSPTKLQILNALVIVGSVLLCLLLSLTRLPGMVLLGIGPNLPLIWVVSWSVKRSVFQGAIAGLALGMIQDGMTSPSPSHILALVIVGVLTAKIEKQRYIQEDFISIALIVFVMAILAEFITGLQYSFHHWGQLSELWEQRQRLALASAILSSLWAPAVYYPLNRWWEMSNE